MTSEYMGMNNSNGVEGSCEEWDSIFMHNMPTVIVQYTALANTPLKTYPSRV